jgi:hypothetical protein
MRFSVTSDRMRSLLLVGVIAFAGCFTQEEDDQFFPVPDLSMPTAPVDLAGASTDGGATMTSLGSGRARPADQPAAHVLAGGSLTTPDGQYGFTVTANGQGGYRVAWVDPSLVGLRFHGSVFVHGSFSQISSTGMNYATANGERLDFESAPGAGQLGYVDFVSSTDPITVDVLAGSQGGTIWFPDTNGTVTMTITPATFTSP